MIALMKIMPRPLRRAVAHVGRRGLFLLAWAFLWINSGVRWSVKPPITEYYDLMYRILPPPTWGYVFMLTGLVMAAGAFWKRLDPISFAFSAWIVSGLAVAVIGTGPSAAGWTVVGTYISYTVIVLVASSLPEVPAERPKAEAPLKVE